MKLCLPKKFCWSSLLHPGNAILPHVFSHFDVVVVHTIIRRMDKHWIVVGAGPCGIGSVARLLDRGMTITWIDPSFATGRMGDYYKNVPSNTLNGDLLRAFEICNALCLAEAEVMVKHKGGVAMTELERKRCYDLGVFVAVLEEVTTILKGKCTVVVGKAVEAHRESAASNSVWKVCVECPDGVQWHESAALLVCCGAAPVELPSLTIPPALAALPSAEVNGILLHNLDYMVNPAHVRGLLADAPFTEDGGLRSPSNSLTDEVWAVVGNSHSAMLVVKNLHDCGVKRILNFHRSELKFMHVTEEGWTRYQGVGLKGPVGEWARDVYISSASIEKIRIPAGVDAADLVRLAGVRHCVVAVGYQRDLHGLTVRIGGHALTAADWDAYDRMTGEIPADPIRSMESEPETVVVTESKGCSRLFGGGIAFPRDLIDGGGAREPWVGFKRSIEQVDLMVAAYTASCAAQGDC